MVYVSLLSKYLSPHVPHSLECFVILVAFWASSVTSDDVVLVWVYLTDKCELKLWLDSQDFVMIVAVDFVSRAICLDYFFLDVCCDPFVVSDTVISFLSP